MLKIMFILFAAIVLCIYAAPNIEESDNIRENPQIDNAEPKLDSEPKESSGVAKVQNSKKPGQRQKRFNDFFDFGFSSYDQYSPIYVKRDDSQNTGVYGAQDSLSQILKRVQSILNYTRRQAFSPPIAHYPVPSFIPFLYIPNDACGCNPAETPNDDGSSHDARPSPPPTTTPTADRTTQQTSPANEPSPTDDTNKTTPDFSSRLPNIDDEEGDGSRPISFVPVKPKTPLSRPPPPVEHGSNQAGIGGSVQEEAAVLITTSRPIVVAGLPSQPHLPTNSIPTLCDGAVLTCCHRAEVSYDCFLSQGCPNPTSPANPCDENIILNVINKFQYYYANRRL